MVSVVDGLEVVVVGLEVVDVQVIGGVAAAVLRVGVAAAVRVRVQVIGWVVVGMDLHRMCVKGKASHQFVFVNMFISREVPGFWQTNMMLNSLPFKIQKNN